MEMTEEMMDDTLGDAVRVMWGCSYACECVSNVISVKLVCFLCNITPRVNLLTQPLAIYLV
jgi:hypothetical protein